MVQLKELSPLVMNYFLTLLSVCAMAYGRNLGGQVSEGPISLYLEVGGVCSMNGDKSKIHRHVELSQDLTVPNSENRNLGAAYHDDTKE